MKKKNIILLIILIIAIIIFSNYIVIQITKIFDAKKVDNDYKELEISIEDQDIIYYTVYNRGYFNEYKVYQIYSNSMKKIKKQVENNNLWTRKKFFEYIMKNFYEKSEKQRIDIDRGDLYYYARKDINAILDIKNAKLYLLKKATYDLDNDDSKILETSIDNYINKEAYSVKGRLQNDGTDYYVYQFTDEKGKQIEQNLSKSEKWNKQRLEDKILDVFKYNKEVYVIENGYYYHELICRTSDEYKKTHFTKEEATGYEIGVYDSDKNILYYYWTSI